MPWSTTLGVESGLFAEEGLVLHCFLGLDFIYDLVSDMSKRTLGAEELSGDVDLLAANDDELLAVEKLLGHSGGQTTKEMALAVNDNLLTSNSA